MAYAKIQTQESPHGTIAPPDPPNNQGGTRSPRPVVTLAMHTNRSQAYR